MQGINLSTDNVYFPANLSFLGCIPVGEMEDDLLLDLVCQIPRVLRQCWMRVEVALNLSCLLSLTMYLSVVDKCFELSELISEHQVPPVICVFRFCVRNSLRQ